MPPLFPSYDDFRCHWWMLEGPTSSKNSRSWCSGDAQGCTEGSAAIPLQKARPYSVTSPMKNCRPNWEMLVLCSILYSSSMPHYSIHVTITDVVGECWAPCHQRIPEVDALMVLRGAQKDQLRYLYKTPGRIQWYCRWRAACPTHSTCGVQLMVTHTIRPKLNQWRVHERP